MSTSASFFVGKGKTAEFLFGVDFDGYPEDEIGHGIPKRILISQSEQEFRDLVKEYSVTVDKDNVVIVKAGYRWPTDRGFCYVYAFFDGHAWITTGGRWFNPFIRAKRPKSLPPAPVTRKGTVDGKITVTCGECLYPKTVTAEQLVRWFSKMPSGSYRRIFDQYFKSKGFFKSRTQGWLCRACSAK